MAGMPSEIVNGSTVYFVVTVYERILLTAAPMNCNFEFAPTAKFHYKFKKNL